MSFLKSTFDTIFSKVTNIQAGNYRIMLFREITSWDNKNFNNEFVKIRQVRMTIFQDFKSTSNFKRLNVEEKEKL